ncbi:MAG: YtxH domain-containing protein [Chloroflexota bacterium]
MVNKNQELVYHTDVVGVLAGMVIGGLAGAVTMLLLAPQSGKRTRMQIQEKGIELRDQATGIVEDAVAQVRLDGNKLARDGRRNATKLLHQGQELVADQIEYVTDAVKAGKKAIQSS